MLSQLPVGTSFFHDSNTIYGLYIVAFGLFIYGLSGLTGPRTAVRGNRIAAAGMVIAVVTTLLIPALDPDGEVIPGFGCDTLPTRSMRTRETGGS